MASNCIVLKGGTLLMFNDADEAIEVLRNTSLLVIDGRIAAIGNFIDLSIPAGADIINVEGRIVSPGFVNTHVHSGARYWWCYDLIDRPHFPLEQQWEALAYIARRPHASRAALGLALDGTGHTIRADPDAELKLLKEKTKGLDVQALTLHEMCGGAWPMQGTSASDWSRLGLQQLGLPLILSHSPFLKMSDIQALREHDFNISIAPESEFHYGHGQTASHCISDQASLGLDTAFTFSGDMITQARLWLQAVRSKNYQKTVDDGFIPRETPMTVEQAFLLATRQGGLALRRRDVGVLQVGAKADLAIFNGESPNMLGWSDPVAAVILHAHPSDVEHVLVDGRFRKRDFRLVDLKVPWSEVKERFVEAAKRVKPYAAVGEHPLPDKLWGQGTFGGVEVASTVRRSI
ncbi:hypothetical protein EJ03DRAFT_318803 [Teratosphaeria nubilosa]|uniref:Amidohydrolase-related domain-containing protein n=1 Tax=Teratosphaeria nubilosa TaxID=161662 RepID=A0A6G1KYL8_9PEZI|nr:hypothetical protein EJ03DRAFT_318803 [Teratosphaeria nubilosa]